MTSAPTLAARNRQRGVTLVIGLIMLLVMTVLAVSTMGTARLELIMAGNTQARENAFQLAQAGVDREITGFITDRALLDDAPPCPAPGDPAVPASDPVAIADLGGSYSTSVCFRGFGSDLVSGSSVGKVEQGHYELLADATAAESRGRSVLVQGFYVLQPVTPD
jgi:Tfp pilus assembly protein PilX